MDQTLVGYGCMTNRPEGIWFWWGGRFSRYFRSGFLPVVLPEVSVKLFGWDSILDCWTICPVPGGVIFCGCGLSSDHVWGGVKRTKELPQIYSIIWFIDEYRLKAFREIFYLSLSDWRWNCPYLVFFERKDPARLVCRLEGSYERFGGGFLTVHVRKCRKTGSYCGLCEFLLNKKWIKCVFQQYTVCKFSGKEIRKYPVLMLPFACLSNNTARYKVLFRKCRLYFFPFESGKYFW